MSIKDFTQRFLEFWGDFKKEKSGLVGLGILLLAVLVVIFEPVFLPFKATNSNWRNITYWEDNSASAPPIWTNWFTKEKSAVTVFNHKPQITEETDPEYGKVRVYTFDYNFKYSKAPLDMIFKANGNGDILMYFSIIRADGKEIFLGQKIEQSLTDDPIRYSINNNSRSSVIEFVRQEAGSWAASNTGNATVRPLNVIFSQLSDDMLIAKTPLNGDYKFKIKIPSSTFENSNNKIEDPYMIISGRVSGILGTDTSKRDIFSGIIAGLKWALFIGLFTSIVSVLVGVMYGIIMAYVGGAVDTFMSFIFEIFIAVPMMPVLIVLSAVYKPSIWVIIAAMLVFYWTGPVKTVRSMALQIKEETYIEAANALGASKWRIIFKHMAPLLLPYSFANMALSVPGAIVAESSLSLLGLGDPTIVTWGQILHDAQASGATLNGLWWWIIPPGLFIALMGMTFAFIGFAMDKILHPKLRTR